MEHLQPSEGLALFGIEAFHPKESETFFIQNAKSTQQSNFTWRRTGRHGGGCDGDCILRVVKPIRTEGLYEAKNVGITYVAKCNLRVVDMVDPMEQILVVTMGDIEFFYPHNHACRLRGTVTGRRWLQSDLFLQTRPFHGGWGTGLLRIIAWVSFSYEPDGRRLPSAEEISKFSPHWKGQG